MRTHRGIATLGRVMLMVGVGVCAVGLGGCYLREGDAADLVDGRPAAQRREAAPFGMEHSWFER